MFYLSSSEKETDAPGSWVPFPNLLLWEVMNQDDSKAPALFFLPGHLPASPRANWRQWPTKLVHVWTQLLLLLSYLIATEGHLYPPLRLTLWPHKRQKRSQRRLVRRTLGTRNMGILSKWRVSGIWKHSITGQLVSQRFNFWFRTQLLCLWPFPRSKNQDTIWGGMSFLPGWSRANNPIIVIRKWGKWHIHWSPAKENFPVWTSKESKVGEAQSLGEQNILYCSFEMVPTQFPQSHASNSFSILTFPYYCVPRENSNLSTPRDLISKDTTAKSIQGFFKKTLMLFKKLSHCSDKFQNELFYRMPFLTFALTNVFSSSHGMGKFFLLFLHITVYLGGK